MDFSACVPVTVLPTRKKKKHPLLNMPVIVDTETSKHIEKDASGKVTVAYGWVYLFGIEFAGAYYEGRTPTDLLNQLEQIRNHYECSADGTHLVVYIHNLSFDIQYLKDWLIQRYGYFEMLATATHKFITFTVDAFEFRCSYRLANRSLDKWAKDLGVKSQKAVGEIDYTETHYQDEPLSENHHHYQKLDCFTLRDCLFEQMRLFGDNLQTIPLTSTGYVRRIARKNFRKRKGSVEQFRKTQLSPTTYVMCRKEFAGAITHGNRFYMGQIVKGIIRHRDFDSHYPTQQRARQLGFPASRFMIYFGERSRKKGKKLTVEKLQALVKEHCFLVEIAIKNLRVKDGVTLPYAQASKFIDGRQSDWKRPLLDNGRILETYGTSIVVLNEIDFSIIAEDYTFEYEILSVYTAKRGPVPEFLAETVDEFYREKTRLKNKVKQLKKAGAPQKEIDEAERDLLRVKGLLNSVYGMSATNIVRQEISMDSNGIWSEEELTIETLKDKLYRYYGNFNSFMSYQLGCWTTSLARWQLWYVVKHVIGYENYLYCDTDSCFYISTPEIEARLNAYVSDCQRRSEAKGAFIEVDGIRKIYDRFDDEGEEITEFCFLHAKAYCYKTSDGELHITVAGVPKETNGITRAAELGSIENFKSGFVFKINGGTRAIYTEARPHTIIENGHKLELASACLIENVEKTLHDEISTKGFLYADDDEQFDLL